VAAVCDEGCECVDDNAGDEAVAVAVPVVAVEDADGAPEVMALEPALKPGCKRPCRRSKSKSDISGKRLTSDSHSTRTALDLF
jgi:hypothetical protein